MDCTIEEYLENAKSQLVCNQTGQVDYITYDYTEEQIYKNIGYFEYCLKEGLSAYKALLFFSDCLDGNFGDFKSYQIVTKEEE